MYYNMFGHSSNCNYHNKFSNILLAGLYGWGFYHIINHSYIAAVMFMLFTTPTINTTTNDLSINFSASNMYNNINTILYDIFYCYSLISLKITTKLNPPPSVKKLSLKPDKLRDFNQLLDKNTNLSDKNTNLSDKNTNLLGKNTNLLGKNNPFKAMVLKYDGQEYGINMFDESIWVEGRRFDPEFFKNYLCKHYHYKPADFENINFIYFVECVPKDESPLFEFTENKFIVVDAKDNYKFITL